MNNRKSLKTSTSVLALLASIALFLVTAPRLALAVTVVPGGFPTLLTLPKPRAATPVDVAQLLSLVEQAVPTAGPEAVRYLAIVQNYAVLYYHRVGVPVGNVNGDGAMLADDASGHWVILGHSHGALGVGDIEFWAPTIKPLVADSLVYTIDVKSGVIYLSGNPHHCSTSGVCTQSAPSGKPPK